MVWWSWFSMLMFIEVLSMVLLVFARWSPTQSPHQAPFGPLGRSPGSPASPVPMVPSTSSACSPRSCRADPMRCREWSWPCPCNLAGSWWHVVRCVAEKGWENTDKLRFRCVEKPWGKPFFWFWSPAMVSCQDIRWSSKALRWNGKYVVEKSRFYLLQDDHNVFVHVVD